MGRPTAALALTAVLLATPALGQGLPEGFEAVLVEPYNTPAGFVISPQGLIFVIQLNGKIRVHDGQEPFGPLFIDLTDEVNDDGDRGLLGIVLHPDFVPNGGPSSWVYLLYTVSPVPGQDLGFDEDDKYSFSRLTRYRAMPSAGSIIADPASRQVLLGNQLPDGSVPDCIASLHNSHSNGSLHFADDGSLLVATGDGAHYEVTADTGGIDAPGFDDWIHPVTGLRGPTPALQDSGALRSQDVRSLAGKILRIDPATGQGYASNPFYDGDPSSNASRVWALGLRNPFRVSLFPGTGASDPALGQPNVLAIGDVGWADWEELNICKGGENFEWPCVQGPESSAAFGAFNPPLPTSPNCNTTLSGTLTGPAVTWNHSTATLYEPPGAYVDESGTPLSGFAGACSIGGTVYDGGTYPDIYDGRVFFADFAWGWMNTLEVDANHDVVAVRPFGSNMFTVVAIERHPVTGDLYYLDRTTGLKHLRYTEPDAVKVYGCGVNPVGSLTLQQASVHIGETAGFVLHNPLGTQLPGSLTTLGFAFAPDPSFPCGTLLPEFGMSGFLASGEVLLGLGSLFDPVPGPSWPGTPVTLNIPVPSLAPLIGHTVYAQGLILDPTFGGGGGAGLGLTDALELLIGS